MSLSRIDPRVRELARQFGLDWRGDCAKRLREHALSKVRVIMESMAVDSAGTLLQVVASMVSVKLLFVHEDGDLLRYADEYGQGWPQLAGHLRHDFTHRDTIGLVLAHPAPKKGAHRNIAFIDSRGERSVSAYFTACHEIAHLLLQPPQLSFSGFRRVNLDVIQAKDPLEALVDQVAGDLAFFEPFVKPELTREIALVGHLTLDGIDRVRNAVAPEASFSSTAHALARMSDQPMAFLVADVRLKPSEARSLKNDQLTFIASAVPQKKLRLVSAFPNDSATTAGFKIFRHMRVPQGSLIAKVYDGIAGETAVGLEDQENWESGGRQLPALGLHVEGRKFGSVVYALVSCNPG